MEPVVLNALENGNAELLPSHLDRRVRPPETLGQFGIRPGAMMARTRGGSNREAALEVRSFGKNRSVVPDASRGAVPQPATNPSEVGQ